MNFRNKKGDNYMPASHDIGPWSVIDGFLSNRYNKYNLIAPYEITAVIDEGCLLKVGHLETTQVYFNRLISSQKKMGIKHITLRLIQFTNFTELSADDICTLINYMNNCIGEEKMNTLFNMSKEKLKAKIETLSRIGF